MFTSKPAELEPLFRAVEAVQVRLQVVVVRDVHGLL